MGSFPDTYLGMPLGAKFKLEGVWQPLIERVREWLALWKRRHLTRGGRLIEYILESLPVYMMSLFVPPSCVLKELSTITWNLLWGGTQEKKKHSTLLVERKGCAFE